MGLNVYECLFLLDSTKVAGDLPAAAQQLHGILEKNQVEILASRPWDDRRLSYPVKGQKKGLYYLTYFKSDGKRLVGIEQDCKLNEMILRMLMLKIDPKLVDTMLTLARDEHALALQVTTSEDGVEEGGNGEDRGGPPHRRGGGRRHGDEGKD